MAFARKYNICIVHDNAYSEIVFDGNEGMSFLSVPGAMEVGVEFNSLSKTYNLTGARLSFLLGNKAILERFRALRTQIDYGLFLCGAARRHRRAGRAAGGRRTPARGIPAPPRRALPQLHPPPGGKCPTPGGTMFVWAKTPRGWEDDEAFVTALFARTGILCTPGSAFASRGKGHVRFALVRRRRN